MRRLACFAAVLVLGGCDMLGAALKPLPERVNAAFPLPDDVEVARSRLLASLDGDDRSKAQVTSQFAQLMEARALGCSASAPIGRFDSAARIRANVPDTGCFRRQDAQLDEWIALRRIAIVLRSPPLVAAEALPPKVMLPQVGPVGSGVLLAERSNVMVVRDPQQQRFVAMQVPAGKEIGNFSLPEPPARKLSLSPNGRLLAAGSGKGLRVLEVASGNTLWSSDKYQDVVVWLADAEALVVSQLNTNLPQLVDLRAGTIAPYPLQERGLSWSLPAGEGRVLVGSLHAATLMQHARESGGALAIVPIRQVKFVPEGLLIGATPMLMNQGRRLVYPTIHRDLAWVDLASGERGAWTLSVLQPKNFAKVGDNLVAFDGYGSGERSETAIVSMITRVIDTERATVAAAKDSGDLDGQLMPLSPRTGYMKWGATGATIGGGMAQSEPQDLDRYIADVLLAQQLSKLKEPGAFLPGTVTDRNPVGVVGTPMLQGLPADAKVTMVGVYEAERQTSRSVPGPIVVSIDGGSAPLVLVLSNYEKVSWVIRNPGNRRIAAVLLSGYENSSVVGHGSAQVLRIGRTFAYELNSGEFAQLRREVARYVGNGIPTFQGRYRGSEFNVQ